MSREHERQLIAFLANSDEVASLAASRLSTRMAERNQMLSDLTGKLSVAEQACQSAALKAVQPAQRLQKAREAFEAACREDFEARRHADGAASQVQKLKANAWRRAAELADPRINDLRRWVLRLQNVAHCEEVEEVLNTYLEGRRIVFRTPGANAAALLKSMNELEIIVHDLTEMLKAPYGPELATTLLSKQLEAETIARRVIPGIRFDLVMEDRPDLTVLPLPTARSMG